jgi:hypothetical protein
VLIIHANPHPKAPARPFTPEVLQTKEHAPTIFSFIFIFKLTFESFKECEGASKEHHLNKGD